MDNENTGFIKKHREHLLILALGVVTCCYLVLCAVNIFAAFTLLFACAAIYSFYKNADSAFWLYIMVLPFSALPLFNSLPFGISSVRILILLFVVLFILFVIYKKPQRTTAVFSVFLVVLTLLFVISWVRSFGYAPGALSSLYAEELSTLGYLMNYLPWTFIVFIPMIGIAYFYREEKDFENIIKTVVFSSILMVGCLFAIFIFKVGNKYDFETIRVEFGTFFGLHANDIVNYFIVLFPVILAWAFYRKSRFSLLALLFIIAGTLLCFSRTAYFVVAFAFFLFLFLTGRLKWIPIVALITVLTVNFLLPDIVLDRAMTGFDSGNYVELSAGRIEYIWSPLLNELKTNPQMLVFGSGRYGIFNTDAWREARILFVNHAHNMYLDAVLDAGLIGLAVFLLFFASLFCLFYKYAKRSKKTYPFCSSLLTGCIVSIVSYLISGMSGRTFFPAITNAYLWIVIGLGVAICSSLKTSTGNE